jgi:hypothetical protein
LAEVLAQRVREYIALYKERKKDLLAKEVKRGLKLLMHKRGFVHDVKVHIIGDLIEIDLYNKRGEVIAKEGLSKGEQQLYATALLYGLVEESDVDFPVFIDSPMQKGGVLGLHGDDVPAPAGIAIGHALHSQVNGLGSAGGENQLGRLAAQQLRNLLSRQLHGLVRP